MEMTLEDFSRSAKAGGGIPPPGLSAPLRALWHDARGDWDQAHRCAQEDPGAPGSWVHAYLHRKEGDAGNAAYWYAKARRRVPEVPLEREWQSIAQELLDS